LYNIHIHIHTGAAMTAPPPKKGRLSLYEDRISESSRAEIQAREDQKVAAEAAKKKKDGTVS
jgi:splicing factor 45